MKVTLAKEFTLPDDKESYENAFHADEMYRTLKDIDDLVRGVLKYHQVTVKTRELYARLQELLQDFRARNM